MSIFHLEAHANAASEVNPSSLAADAILVEHVMIDPSIVPVLQDTYGSELTALTAEVAKAQRLKAVETTHPTGTKATADFINGTLDFRTEVIQGEVSSTFTDSSLENMRDTLVQPVTAQVPPRQFTREESNVIDTALGLVAMYGREPQGRPHDLAAAVDDVNVMMSGSSGRPRYSDQAQDLLSRRIESRTLRGRVANMLSHMPHVRIA